MVTLRQLEYFVTVVEESSFTGAAELLMVSQPGLSHQVAALEQALGGRLLERLPAGPRLTPLGRAVLGPARAAVAERRTVLDLADRVLRGGAGELRVATITSLSVGVLPGVVARWRQDAPQVPVSVVEHRDVADLGRTMLEGAADVAVSPVPPGWMGPTREVGVEELVVVLGPQDPRALAGQRRVDVADLAEVPWVHFDPDHGLAGVLDHVCAGHGFSPRVAMRTEQSAAAPLYAAAGVGATLVPASMVPQHFAGHVLRPLPPIRRPVHVFGRGGDLDALSRRFADLALAHADLNPQHVRDRCGVGTPQ